MQPFSEDDAGTIRTGADVGTNHPTLPFGSDSEPETRIATPSASSPSFEAVEPPQPDPRLALRYAAVAYDKILEAAATLPEVIHKVASAWHLRPGEHAVIWKDARIVVGILEGTSTGLKSSTRAERE
jgi:hypothetical protein